MSEKYLVTFYLNDLSHIIRAVKHAAPQHCVIIPLNAKGKEGNNGSSKGDQDKKLLDALSENMSKEENDVFFSVYHPPVEGEFLREHVGQVILSLGELIQGLNGKMILDLGELDAMRAMFAYNASLHYRQVIEKVMLITNSGKINELWPFQKLKSTERAILYFLVQHYPEALSMSELLEEYQKRFHQGQLPLISKLVRQLVKEGLAEIRKEGRTRLVRLTSFGLTCVPIPLFLHHLKEKMQHVFSRPRKRLEEVPTSAVLSERELMLLEGFTELDDWLKFKESTFFTKDDFEASRMLGFNIKEGLAFYVYLAIKQLVSRKTEFSMDELLDVIIQLLQERKEIARVKKGLLDKVHFRRFLSATRDEQVRQLAYLCQHQNQIKSLVVYDPNSHVLKKRNYDPDSSIS